MGIHLTDILLFGKAVESSVDSGTFRIYRRNILRWGAISHAVDVVVHGVSPLSLPDAVADSLQYVKAFGGTEQRNLPDGYTQLEYIESTGTQYIDTGVTTPASNSTVTKFEANVAYVSSAANQRNFIAGYKDYTHGHYCEFRNDKFGFSNGSIGYYSPTLTAETPYDVTMQINGSNNVQLGINIGGTDYTKSFTQYQGDTMGQFVLFMLDSSYISKGLRMYSAKLTINGTLVRNMIPVRNNATGKYGMYDTVSGQFFTNQGTGDFVAGPEAVPTPDTPMDIVSNNGALRANINEFDANAITNGYFYNADLEWVANSSVYTTDYMRTVKGKYTLALGNVSTVSSTVNVRVNLFNANKEIQSQTVIPIAPDTTEYICEVNIPDGISYVRVSTNPMYVVVSGFNNSKTIYTDGTVETIEDTIGNTATAEMLLKVGDYQDQQEIIDGTVTRNIGVKVLDGTEDWNYNNIRFSMILSGAPESNNNIAVCSHYKNVIGTTPVADMSNQTFKLNNLNRQLIFKDSSFTTLSAWTTFLANQYAAGTPVIVVYPLATPTTESVTGQTLQVTDGDNVLEITQASLNGLELEAQYQAAVSLTIQEVQDANLDPNVEVTIN